MIGTSLNQYRITASIGVGEMGEVFRARDTPAQPRCGDQGVTDGFRERCGPAVKIRAGGEDAGGANVLKRSESENKL